MANTLSVMSNVLRNAVSKQRIRYKENGYNLDLSYIYDNIIAMGYPGDKLEGFYRNRLEDVFKFLEENHLDHYKIYNLCLERSYDIEKFHGRVAIYPFEDHNPPTIELILRFCADVDAWLKTDSRNVVAVHCKAGKGRTGTMICCYLLYSGFQRTAEAALGWYDEKRTKDRKGVTIPSQRRYVQYFSTLISSGETYEKLSLRLCEIRFSETNFLSNHGNVNCTVSVLQDSATTQKVEVQRLEDWIIDFHKSFKLDINSSLLVAGDIKVELSRNKKTFFHFWFNTYFVPQAATREGEGSDAKYIYTLNKHEIDDAHKDHKNYSEDFKVQLVFYAENTTENPVGDGCNSPVYLNSSSEYDVSYSEQSGCASNSHVDAINGLNDDSKTHPLNNCQQFKLNINSTQVQKPIRHQMQPFLSNSDTITSTPKRKQSKLNMNATKSDEIILTAEIHNESIKFQPSTLQSCSNEYQYGDGEQQQQQQSVRGRHSNHPQHPTNIAEKSRTSSSHHDMKTDDIFWDCDSRLTASSSSSSSKVQQELPIKAFSNLNLPSSKRKTESLLANSSRNAQSNGGELINCFEDQQRPTSLMDKHRFFSQKSKTQDVNNWLGSDWKKKEKLLPISKKTISARNNPPQQPPPPPKDKKTAAYHEASKFNTNPNDNETKETTSSTTTKNSGHNTSGNVVATTKAPNSKQKLKTKFKKNKLKFSQKLQFFHSFFHSDPIDFRQNFVKHVEIRRNSTSSLIGRSKVQIANISGATSKSMNNQLLLSTSCPNDSSKVVEYQQNVKLTTKLSNSLPQIHNESGKEFCDDFYSLICEKQLSFNNSPCKSPRSFFENPTTVAGKLFLQHHHQQQHPQQPQHQHQQHEQHLQQYRNERGIVRPSSSNTNDNSIVIVAAKPAKIDSIGFKIEQPQQHNDDVAAAVGDDGIKTDYMGNLQLMENDNTLTRNPYKMDNLKDALPISINKSPGQMIDSDNRNTNMTNGNYYGNCTKLNCSGCSDCAATSMMHLKKPTLSSMMCVANQKPTEMNCKQTSVSPETTLRKQLSYKDNE